MEGEEQDVDFKTARALFLKDQVTRINQNYTGWQRKVMSSIAGVEAKIRHRKIPKMDDSQPGSVYVRDRRFGGESFFYFTTDHPLRRTAIRIITDSWYLKF